MTVCIHRQDMDLSRVDTSLSADCLYDDGLMKQTTDDDGFCYVVDMSVCQSNLTTTHNNTNAVRRQLLLLIIMLSQSVLGYLFTNRSAFCSLLLIVECFCVYMQYRSASSSTFCHRLIRLLNGDTAIVFVCLSVCVDRLLLWCLLWWPHLWSTQWWHWSCLCLSTSVCLSVCLCR